MDWASIFRSLKPQQIADELVQIDFAALRARGIKYLILDVDNTLTYGKYHMTLDNRQHILAALRANYIENVVLLSNIVFESGRRRKRIETIARDLNQCQYICAVLPRIKPHPAAFAEAMAALPSDATVANTAVIGDQLFTDIRGGNRNGLYTIYVRPLGPEALWMLPKRWAEHIIFSLTGWRRS